MLYQVFGLVVNSCIELPELNITQGNPDVVIEFGKLDRVDSLAPKGAIRYTVDKDLLRLQLESIGMFYVENGNRIIIDLDEGVSPESIKSVLLGSIFSALLTQRHIIQLHASAIMHPRGSVLFAGESGVGKSTLATGMMNRGYAVLSDDVSAIDFDNAGHPWAIPSYPQMKLWRESIDLFNLDFDSLRKINNRYEKRALPLDGSGFYNEKLPIHKVYFLDTHDGELIKIDQLNSAEAFVRLRKCIFRMQFHQNSELLKSFFQSATKLLDSVPIRILSRPKKGLDDFDKYLDIIQADLDN